MSLGRETKSLRLDLTTLQIQTRSNRQVTFGEIEAFINEFHTRLEEAEELAGQGQGTQNSLSTAKYRVRRNCSVECSGPSLRQ
jgi:hypothetical protein